VINISYNWRDTYQPSTKIGCDGIAVFFMAQMTPKHEWWSILAMFSFTIHRWWSWDVSTWTDGWFKHPRYSWTNPTYPIFNWVYNPLTRWGEPPNMINGHFCRGWPADYHEPEPVDIVSIASWYLTHTHKNESNPILGVNSHIYIYTYIYIYATSPAITINKFKIWGLHIYIYNYIWYVYCLAFSTWQPSPGDTATGELRRDV